MVKKIFQTLASLFTRTSKYLKTLQKKSKNNKKVNYTHYPTVPQKKNPNVPHKKTLKLKKTSKQM